MSEGEELVVIYAGNSVNTGLLKGLLEHAGIAVFLQDEVIGSMVPAYATLGGVGAIKVVVAKKDIDKARSIVQEFLSETET